MENTRIVLDPAFNNADVLNHFYDSKNGKICEIKRFKLQAISDEKKNIDPDVKTNVVTCRDDFLEVLKIGPEMKLGLLAGLVENDLAKAFLFKSSNIDEKICFIQIQIVTSEVSYKKFSLTDNDKKLITEHLSKNETFLTHKIEGLIFGYKWIVSLKYKDEDSYLENNLESTANTIKSQIENDTEIKDIENTYKITFFDNYLNKARIKSFKEIQSIIKNIKNKKTSKPSLLEIKLMDMKNFLEDNLISNELKTENYDENDIFELSRRCFIDLDRLHKINSYSEYLTEKEKQIGDKIKGSREYFQKNFKNEVINMRKGSKKELKKRLTEIDEQTQSYNNHTGDVFDRIKDIESFKEWKINFLVEKEKQKLSKKENVLYWGYNQKLKKKYEEDWMSLRSTILTCLFEKYFKHIFVFDYDLHGDNIPDVCINNKELKMCLFKLENDDYTKFSLKKIKSNKQTMDDDYKNILLLGESGVGKSTFINAILNYFLFESLDEAEKEKPRCPIHAKFTYYDDKHKMIDVEMGDKNDNNEKFKEGESSTQEARAYELKEKKVRIIDTPGMGDTRGIEVDRENFRNTVNYISKFGYLDCICFLVKPNSVRLGQVFQYCFKELFSNLSKSSVKNIVFCFTNTRGTMYRPGETINPLTQLVNDINDTFDVEIPLKFENIFCLDNEGFRYLMLIKKEIQLESSERKNYVHSWEHSVSESKRMLSYIGSLERMRSNDIVVLNKFKFGLMDWASEAINILKDLEKEIISREAELSESPSRSKITKLETQIQKLSNAQNNIIHYCSQLYSYVRKHSIAIFNDYFEAHLDESIREEGNKEYATKSESILLIKLKELKNGYVKERKKAQVPTEDEYEEIRDNLSKYKTKEIDEILKDE